MPEFTTPATSTEERQRLCCWVCPFVPKISHKVMNGFWWNVLKGRGVAQEPTTQILMAIQYGIMTQGSWKLIRIIRYITR